MTLYLCMYAYAQLPPFPRATAEWDKMKIKKVLLEERAKNSGGLSLSPGPRPHARAQCMSMPTHFQIQSTYGDITSIWLWLEQGGNNSEKEWVRLLSPVPPQNLSLSLRQTDNDNSFISSNPSLPPPARRRFGKTGSGQRAGLYAFMYMCIWMRARTLLFSRGWNREFWRHEKIFFPALRTLSLPGRSPFMGRDILNSSEPLRGRGSPNKLPTLLWPTLGKLVKNISTETVPNRRSFMDRQGKEIGVFFEGFLHYYILIHMYGM